MVKTKLFIILCWFQNLLHADNAMVNDGAGFDRLLNCLCNNSDATKTDFPENCTTEKGIYGQYLCNLMETESKESILNDCPSTKKTFCEGDKMINQRRHYNKTLCMDALMKCKGGRKGDKIKKSSTVRKNKEKEDKQRTAEKQRTTEKDSENSDITTIIDKTTYNGKENDGWNKRKDKWDRKYKWRRKDRNKQFFKVGAIVGISVGVTCTIILVLVILAIIFVCRRRSKKKKRKQLTRLQSIDQRFEMANLESSPSRTNKGEYTILSTNKSLNTDEAQGECFVLDPFTKYDKDLSNRKLPEIKRFSGAEGDENVYYEIDEDKIESSTDMEGVHQKKIEVRDQGSHHSDLTINQTQLGSKKKRKQQTRQLSINQRLEIKNYESGAFSTDKGGYNVRSTYKPLNADEAQGEYFVLDPFITKYDKNLSNRKLPEITRFSGAEGGENVYYEIDEDKIKSSTGIGGVDQKKIEVIDKGSYHSDQTRYEIQLGSIKKKSEQLTKQQSIDQRSEIASLESSPFSTNNGANTILFANESLNNNKAQGEYFVLDPSITKYDKDLSSLVLPEIKRRSVAQSDERVYNEIDEDELQPRTDMEGVRKKPIEEVKDKSSDHGDQKIYESRGSTKNNREQLKRPQSVNQRTEIAHLENSPSSTNKEGNVILSANDSLDTDEAQGEYFVLDPFVTKYDKDLSGRVLPEVKRFRVAQGNENVYNEIYEDKIESSTDMNKDQEKPIGEIGDIVICHSNQTNNEIQLGFDNTSYHVR
ncbi:uncharacterized protein LOC127707660 isoform X2 [Mytilus californianus]|uniref:uncharacterized protein LOC127707660 isoform X2 n=1 Tax=Mytilus californianus TaxID=6549 RepID=UPI002247FE1B|nr:uncharacterized protein LOC127707660 isoform X2 [Mytilus californianus]